MRRRVHRVAWWKKDSEQESHNSERGGQKSALGRNIDKDSADSKLHIKESLSGGSIRLTAADLEKKYGTVRSALGAGTVIQGKLSFDTPVRIDGSLIGEIFSSSVLIVGPQGSVSADINVETLVVFGSVSGEIKARKQLEVFASGEVVGNIVTPSLTVEDGAYFDGTCSMAAASDPASRSDLNEDKTRTATGKTRKESSSIPVTKNHSKQPKTSATAPEGSSPKVTSPEVSNTESAVESDSKIENAIH
jgi:cytoskeletal protein CcmA (bactofilin family)